MNHPWPPPMAIPAIVTTVTIRRMGVLRVWQLIPMHILHLTCLHLARPIHFRTISLTTPRFPRWAVGVPV
jgi:hypothetical protein